jgi:hypothetical protein
MYVELAERLGGRVDEWATGPYAYALYCSLHLHEIDYRRSWERRVERIILADLVSKGVHEPPKLNDEMRKAILDAGPRAPWMDDAALRLYGQRVIAEMEQGKVFS